MFLSPQRACVNRVASLALCCFIAPTALAQTSADPLAFAQRLEFPRSTAWGDQAGEQYQVEITRVRLRWPVFLDGKRTILLPGVSYEHLDINARGTTSLVGRPQASSSDLSLHAPLAEVGLAHRVNDHWMLHGTFSGGFASDFAGPHTHDDLAFIGRLIALYRTDDRLTLGFGAAYDTSTGNISFIPLGIVKWAPSSRWLVSTLLPKVVMASYHTASWLSTSLRAELDLSRYHLDESQHGIKRLYLRYLGVMFGPALTVSTDRYVHLDFFSGFALRWVGTYVYEGPPGVDLYFNAPDPVHAVVLTPSAFLSVRLWIGLEGWR
jgi:outer membrane receptor protein involved in Fe transport